MLNISPIGRSCTLEERIEFSEIDKVEFQNTHGSPTWKTSYLRAASLSFLESYHPAAILPNPNTAMLILTISWLRLKWKPTGGSISRIMAGQPLPYLISPLNPVNKCSWVWIQSGVLL